MRQQPVVPVPSHTAANPPAKHTQQQADGNGQREHRWLLATSPQQAPPHLLLGWRLLCGGHLLLLLLRCCCRLLLLRGASARVAAGAAAQWWRAGWRHGWHGSCSWPPPCLGLPLAMVHLVRAEGGLLVMRHSGAGRLMDMGVPNNRVLTQAACSDTRHSSAHKYGVLRRSPFPSAPTAHLQHLTRVHSRHHSPARPRRRLADGWRRRCGANRNAGSRSSP